MPFKYVTCMTAVPGGDTITLHVLNYATTTEQPGVLRRRETPDRLQQRQTI